MRKFATTIFLLVCTQILPLDFPNFSLGEENAKEEFKRGLTYKNLREYSAAKERFQKAVNLKKDFHLARLELANNYYLLGEWEEALDELEILASKAKNDLLITNKIETLRLAIAGGVTEKERIYFKTIDGDAIRGFRFRNPVDITFDEDGNFYVAGFDTANVIKFNAAGTPISNWRGGITRKLERPVSLVYHNQKIYIADFSRDEVLVFDLNGSFLFSIGGPGKGPGLFRGPSSICFDPSGNLYVADSGNGRIQKFNAKGQFVLEILGIGNSKLINPSGITIDANKLYVVDKDKLQVLIFDGDGNTLETISKPEWKKPRNIKILENQIFLTDELSGIWSYSLLNGDWSLLPKFRDKKGVYRVLFRPFATNMDGTGSLYFVDFGKHRIDIFSQKNNLLSNLDLKIESIDTSDFPNIHIYTRVKNRAGKELIGIDRLSFRIFENDNMTPLFSLANKNKINQKLHIAMVFENSDQLKKGKLNLEDGLLPLFRSLHDSDNISLYRAGKDSQLILPETVSLRDILAKIRDSQSEEKHNFGKASIAALKKLSMETGPKILVYLVSKESKEDSFYQYQKSRIVSYAKAHSIPIYVLTTNPNPTFEESWSDITGPTNGKYIFLDGEGEERDLYKHFRSHTDYRYILSYKTDTNPELINRYIKIGIGVDHRGVKGRDEGGYFVPEPR
ncbi:6-bladed beta-propeller [Leptospira bouyouniensis]|uniref:6-bladed beta-propeller n=1 Tax=Leptospira bouyouniensis TaxID=2484911 RepID=UPI0010912497|nr:6-bladed beta-propeller [Leptospira bouyouniensis]TGM80765.1 6-bladed beta-propeller [Leptospira bouyouniensis]